MANIDTELTALMNAVYGEEVRSAFRDALLKMNNDVIGLITREDLYQMTQEEFAALKTSLINQINAAAATARETIPEDYSTLSDTVAKILDASYPNIMWQAGSLSDTGSDQSSDYVCRSNFIPVTNILGDDIKSKLNVSVTGDYKVEVYKYLIYDRDKNFNRTVTRNHIYPIGYSTTENIPLNSSTADGYVRLVAGCVDDNNQPVSHVTYTESVFTELKESLKVYTTLSWLWEGIEELETDLDEKITDLKADLTNLVEELDFVDYGDVYGWIVGVLNNGEVNTSATTWKTIDGYIQIKPGLTVRLSNVDPSLRFTLAYAYYDSTYTFTNGDIINPTGHYDFANNTENNVYLRVSVSKLHVDNKAIKIYFTVNMLTRLTSLENGVTGLNGNVSTLTNDVLEIKGSVSNLSDVIGVQTPIAAYGYEEDTLLKNDGGTRSNTNYNTTSYIDVTDKRLVLSMSASIAYTFLLCFYDDEQSYIADTFNTYNITGEFEIVTPSNAKYVRLSVSKTNYPRVSLINKNGLYPKIDELTEQIPENSIYNYSGSNIRETLSACYIENSGLVYPQVASGYTKQAIAYYDGVLFQFLADDACTIIDTTTNTSIGTVTADTGHSNTASFSNEFYASGDRFPLCYVGATIDSTNIVKVLRFTNDFTVELIRTLTLPYETFGYSASIAFDRLTNKYYSLANKVSSSGGHISTCVLCELSVDNMTEVSTDVYAPTLVSKKEVNLPASEVYYQQGFKVINGVFFLASGGASATSKAFILVISYSEGEVINVFNSFPSVIANSEFEDMVFIANTFIAAYNIVLHVRDKGYYKFIL